MAFLSPEIYLRPPPRSHRSAASPPERVYQVRAAELPPAASRPRGMPQPSSARSPLAAFGELRVRAGRGPGRRARSRNSTGKQTAADGRGEARKSFLSPSGRRPPPPRSLKRRQSPSRQRLWLRAAPGCGRAELRAPPHPPGAGAAPGSGPAKPSVRVTRSSPRPSGAIAFTPPPQAL